MQSDISNKSQFSKAIRSNAAHAESPASSRVRVFLGGSDLIDDEKGIDWNTLTPGTVQWDGDPAALLWYVADLLSTRLVPSAAHVWYVYMEQGYGQCALLGSFGLHPDVQNRMTVAEGLDCCPRTRFIHCERIPVAALGVLNEEELAGRSDGVYGTHLRTTLQVEAMMFTYYEPCRYTYADEDVARDLAKIEAKDAVRKPRVIYPISITALVLGAILMMVLKVGLWPGISAVVGSVMLLFVLPIVGAEVAIILFEKRMEKTIAADILAKRLPVGGELGQHHAVFSYGPRETTYSDENASRRVGVGTEKFQTTESFVLVTFDDGTMIPVLKEAL